MIEVVLEGEKSRILGPFPFQFVASIIPALSGAKPWKSSEYVSFEDNAYNIEILKSCGFEIKFTDLRNRLKKIEEIREAPTQHQAPEPLPIKYVPKLKHMDHQDRALGLSWQREVYALFLEMGLGKSAIVIANAAILYLTGKIDALLIVAPKGVHSQWILELIPEHIAVNVPWTGDIWQRKPIDFKRPKKKLHVFAINIDSVATQNGYATTESFLKMYKGRAMMVVDESHKIKSKGADRTQACLSLAKYAKYRRILTGTPIAKNLIDAWSQFLFLDQDILGHKYRITFEKEFCIKGGFEGRQIIGNKNIEEFYRRIAPHSFRMTKAEAKDKLPPKLGPFKREYVMSDKTRKAFRDFKVAYLAELDGKLIRAKNAAVGLTKLQEITCGYLRDEDGTLHPISDERLDVLSEMIEQVEGKIVIWCRFVPDVERVEARLSKEYGAGSVVTYYGAVKDKARQENKMKFREGDARFLVGIAQAGGSGLNLQGECQTVIYYSNSFASIDRWQSEDRTHRYGMKGPVSYFDIVAKGSVDAMIIRNLEKKKDLASLSLDEIRQSIIELEPA